MHPGVWIECVTLCVIKIAFLLFVIRKVCEEEYRLYHHLMCDTLLLVFQFHVVCDFFWIYNEDKMHKTKLYWLWERVMILVVFVVVF